MAEIGIIGRQNVGKSSLFNALLRKRISITYDQPGVTRDLVCAQANWGKGSWRLTDFPGLEGKLQANTLEKLSIERAIQELTRFDLLLWVVSIHGLESYDYELANLLRRKQKNVWLVVNFVDDDAKIYAQDDFYRLGIKPIFFVSALNNRNIATVRNALIQHFQALPPRMEKSQVIRFSLIGKPNAGKSTLFNSFLQKDKAMISDIPGTTRDALKETFLYQGNSFEIIDTAGMRRRNALSDNINFYSQKRSEIAIDDADIVFYLIDPMEGFDRQNKTLMQRLEAKGKPMILLLNKKDLINYQQKENLEKNIRDMQKQYWNFPYFFISAFERKKVGKILDKALQLQKAYAKEISAHQLNELLQGLKRHHILEGQNIKLKYINAKEKNNRLLVFSNRNDIPENARRYLKKQLANALGWQELPVSLEFRKSSSRPRIKS